MGNKSYNVCNKSYNVFLNLLSAAMLLLYNVVTSVHFLLVYSHFGTFDTNGSVVEMKKQEVHFTEVNSTSVCVCFTEVISTNLYV